MSLLTGSLRKYESPGLIGDDADDYDVLGANVSSTLADDEEGEEDEDNAKASAALKLAEKSLPSAHVPPQKPPPKKERVCSTLRHGILAHQTNLRRIKPEQEGERR